jgi:hypothetical protein
MKWVSFSLTLILITFSELKGEPNIKFEEKIYDFGEAVQHDSVVHIFKFLNTGDETLKIEKVVSTCGCTAALLSSDQIPPGEEGEIKAVFKTGNFKGKVTKRIKVYSNDPDESLVTLTITGKVKTGVVMSEERIIFGTIKAGDVVSTEITLLPEDGDTLLISEVEGKNLELKLTPYEKNGKHGYKLKVTLNTENQEGVFFSFINLKMEKPWKGRIQIPVNARIVNDVEVFPEVLTLGMINPDKPLVKKVRINNFTSSSLEITDLKWDVPNTEVELKEIEKGKKFELIVTITPDPTTSILKGTITLTTNMKTMPEINIPVYGMVK